MRSSEVIEQLADDAIAFEYVGRRFGQALEAGEFPAREGPTGGESCVILREDAGLLIGFATFYEPTGCDHLMWLDLLWVDPSYRNCGAGRQMVDLVVDRAKDRGCRRVEFGTQATNAAMQALGHAAGFEPSPRVDFHIDLAAT